MSYIVKNCPCIKHYDDIELDNRCMSDQGIPFFCENNPDCVIKRVIEKCLAVRDKYCIAEKFNPRWQDANEILNMFEIERVKE